jgi:outer membrane lipoprotein SlyB
LEQIIMSHSPSKRFSQLAWPAVLITALLATGCATQSNSGTVYRAGEAQVEQVVRMAVIESIRAVTVQRDSKGGGLIAGAVVGGVAGSSVGDGKGSTIASVLGAVGGAIAGQMIEERGNQRPGQEITLRFDTGERRVIVQEADPALQAGARVRVVGSGSAVRVSPQ